MPNKFARFIFRQFRRNETRMRELSYLFWECTTRCNLRCLHCGSDCSADSAAPDMPFDDFLRAVRPLTERYGRDAITVILTGGEPLLRKDIFQCGRQLRENGFRWGIVTNGFAYTPDVHARLLASGLGSLTLSLDGLENAHNRLRSNGDSFRKASAALDLIAGSDRLCYDVVTCVNPGNIADLPALKAFLISKKVKAWRLFTIAPIGRAASAEAGLRLAPQDLKRLMDFIAESRAENRLAVQFSCEAFTGPYETKVRDGFFFCRAGINIASVLIDGSISACPNINRAFIQGCIYADDFLTVWDTRFGLMRNRRWTKTGPCLRCQDYKTCLGGAMHLWPESKAGIMSCIKEELAGI